MAFPGRIFFVKLFHWEYWPFGIIQIPLFFMWLWYSLRERSFFYFSASNPNILSGGMMGESKYEVLTRVPDSLKPQTILIKLPASTEEIERKMEESQLTFPLIFKPDLGERGWMVRRVDNRKDIEDYLAEIKIDFIIQEYVDLPLEFGVYYVRFPSEENGRVNSVTAKEFLYVQGDGRKALQELILEKDRAILQWELLSKKYKNQLDTVLPKGKKEILVTIGNHCLGTKFINGNHLITTHLSESFDRISKMIDGFYFGRFDLRCSSYEDLENGKVKIVELNGCGAEPSHIYHPGASLWSGIDDLITHWQNLYRVSRENHQRGVAYLSFQEGRSIYKKFKALKA
ncbi:MAG TPA: hypothetical protein VGQ59_09720 [Cyclobacteriaceae bacterium]|jgi:hypothetical protein|nr:hypothetical protein [Cyclobacteriaceae bacterium]